MAGAFDLEDDVGVGLAGAAVEVGEAGRALDGDGEAAGQRGGFGDGWRCAGAGGAFCPSGAGAFWEVPVEIVGEMVGERGGA